MVVEQIAETDGRIDAFLAELGGTDPAAATAEDVQPGQVEEQRDATILHAGGRMRSSGPLAVRERLRSASIASRHRRA